MPFYVHGLIILSYLACAVLAGVIAQMRGGDLVGVVALGLSVAVAGGLIHQTIIFNGLIGRIARLRGGTRDVARDTEALRRQMTESLSEIEASRSLNEERVSELRELRALVSQLADKFDRGRPSHSRPAGRHNVAGSPPSSRGAARSTARHSRSATTLARAPLVAVPPQAPIPELILPAKLPDDMSPEDRARLDTVKDALERRRFDLFLQPVVRLPQRRIEFHEAYTRLRAKDGSQIQPEAYLDIATHAGMVSGIDNILLFRCVEHVRRSLEQDLSPKYFCNISTATLSDGGVFADFVEYLEANPQLSDSLIFEISQDQLSQLDDKQNAGLARLTGSGHRLSLDGVTDLDLDINQLTNLQVSFVKLEAGALMPKLGDDPIIDLEGLALTLKQNAIALVVEKIETEEMLLELLEYGIDYGQGFLFGGPRRAQ